MKNIFSFVGRGNYCFVAPVSKDFCYSYLTFDLIEDSYDHKLDYLQAIGRNRITTAEAVSFSLELAEYCFFKAQDNFQEELVRNVASKGRIDILELGLAMGIDVKKAIRRNSESLNLITQQGDLKILQFLHDKGLLFALGTKVSAMKRFAQTILRFKVCARKRMSMDNGNLFLLLWR